MRIRGALLVALLPAAAMAWQATVSEDGPGIGVAVNAAGDVATVGITGSLGTGLVARYSPDGVEQWTVGTAGGRYVAFGAADSVIAGGDLPAVLGYRDWIVYRLDGATGALDWQTQVSARLSPIDPALQALGVDGSGDVIAAGSTDEGTFANEMYTFVVIKLDGATGTQLWRYDLNGTAGPQTADEATAIALDAGGDVFAAGNLLNPAPTLRDVVVVRLDGATGAELWRTSLDGMNTSGDQATTIALDPSGDVLVGGALDTPVGGRGTIAKLDGATGIEQWRHVDATQTLIARVTSDSTGEVVALGEVDVPSADLLCQLVKLAGATGAEVWSETLEPSICSPVAVSTDSADDVLSVVWEGTFGPNATAAVSKRAGSDGSRLWKWLGPEYAVNGAATRGDGQMLITGISKKPGRSDWLLSQVGTLVVGRKLKVVDPLPDRQRLIFKSDRDSTAISAAPGEPGDPTLGGATLTLRNPATLESVSLALPSSGWSGLGSPPGALGYRYFDREFANGPCSKVNLQAKKRRVLLSAKCKGTIGFSLDEASQGSLEVRLTAGTGSGAITYCTRFGGFIKQDAVGSFVATKAAVPASCP